MNFDEFIIALNNEYSNNSERGRRFEDAVACYFKADPFFCFDINTIWRWREFPFKLQFGDGHDVGIDLVILDYSAKYWAIQCKCYNADTLITKKQVDTFIATSARSFIVNGSIKNFEKRIWVSTSDNLTNHAEEVLNNQNPPVFKINRSFLLNSCVNWKTIYNNDPSDQAIPVKFELNLFQKEAVKCAYEYYKKHDRGMLIMACGTGKTITSLKIVESLFPNAKFVLFCIPSITLLSQVSREWVNQSKLPINKICVCSDVGVAKIDLNKADPILDNINDLPTLVTTNHISLYETYQNLKKNNFVCIFTTYQSIDVISKAQKLGMPEFDIIICDEAHRTAGFVGSNDAKISSFVKVHDNKIIKSKFRLYMTATPRLYSATIKERAEYKDTILCSMDDPTIYGYEFYKLSFRKAVDAGLLCDYRVVTLTIKDDDPELQSLNRYYNANSLAKKQNNSGLYKEFNTLVKLAGCKNALSKKFHNPKFVYDDFKPISKVVAYCETIEMSKNITRMYEEWSNSNVEQEKSNIYATIVCDHIDGSMSSNKRDEKLNWLRKNNELDSIEKECRILSNVRCLSEGIDVPALDAIIFLSGKDSQIDVVQSVGRVMRRAENKKYGYIIIPIIVPSGISALDFITQSDEYKIISNVVTALRAHDENMESTIIKIALNKEKPKNIVVIGTNSHSDIESDLNLNDLLNKCSTNDLENVIFAKLVDTLNLKLHWSSWAADVAEVSNKHIQMLTKIYETQECKGLFNNFIANLKLSTNNPNLNARAVIEMLAQHKTTEPIFNALFSDYEFAKFNPITIELDDFLTKISRFTESYNVKNLDELHESIKRRIGILDNLKARQEVIIELYNTFFKVAFPSMAKDLGIVYTPIEIVDFILHSVNDILNNKFGLNLTDENVTILDPFTGTGTFIVRLLQSGLIKPTDLKRKFKKEIFACEIVLLAYYIASINIENTYHALTENKNFNMFEGICLTDTFQFDELAETGIMLGTKNEQRIRNQYEQQITVIIGNPPYSVHGGSDTASNNHKYKKLDENIKKLYILNSNSKLVKSMYDSYIRAFRWATDRIGDNDGVIGFVSNGAYITSTSNNGLRISFENEFSDIFIYDLRGDRRVPGSKCKSEGRNIFGEGSRTPIAITLLVKRKGFKGRATIHYCDIGDSLKTKQKLDKLRESKSFFSDKMPTTRVLKIVKPGEWLIQENPTFKNFTSLAPDKTSRYDELSKSVFTTSALGVTTSRDAWVYGYSRKSLLDKINTCINFYNEQLLKSQINEPTKISWSSWLRQLATRNIKLDLDPILIQKAMYRPFNSRLLYFSNDLNERGIFLKSYFPTQNSINFVICISGAASKNDFSVIISDSIVDFQYLLNTRCFPLYYFEYKTILTDKKKQSNFLLENELDHSIRKDGISDYFAKCVEFKYAKKIAKIDIFYYVYGILHSPEYRTIFADDLKLASPRLPLVASIDDFFTFSRAGYELASIHLNYDTIQTLSSINVVGNTDNLKITKMYFANPNQKDKIIFNNDVSIENIPSIAYEYKLKGISAIEHVMTQYQIKKDKHSGIVNDPNEWCEEINNSNYILNLLLSTISVSVKTMDIVKNLPSLNFNELNDN
ncbi:MAG: DEAD/DEAH box helicase family protein [Christensenellaceae bacterium]|jgi:predicted helicase|nr:DEAD/DEAH box helicase family protein [Christensenellaceae bacterium]